MKKEMLLGDKCEDKNDPSAIDNYSPLPLLFIKFLPFSSVSPFIVLFPNELF